jgi:hypothetical protein
MTTPRSLPFQITGVLHASDSDLIKAAAHLPMPGSPPGIDAPLIGERSAGSAFGLLLMVALQRGLEGLLPDAALELRTSGRLPEREGND